MKRSKNINKRRACAAANRRADSAFAFNRLFCLSLLLGAGALLGVVFAAASVSAQKNRIGTETPNNNNLIYHDQQFKGDGEIGSALGQAPGEYSALNSHTLYLENGQLRGLVGNASQFTRALSNFSPQIGVWHHLAFTYDYAGGVSTL